MAEVQSNGETVGGLPVPHPDEVKIRAQNARRIARRRQAASLALQVQQTSGEDRDRHGERRQVGGTFESLQDVPEREVPTQAGLDMSDILSFLQAMSFAPQSQGLSSTSFLTSFGPFIQGLVNTGAD